MHRFQIRPIVHNWEHPYHFPELHPGPCNAVSQCGDGQPDRRTDGRDQYTFRVVYDSREM